MSDRHTSGIDRNTSNQDTKYWHIIEHYVGRHPVMDIGVYTQYLGAGATPESAKTDAEQKLREDLERPRHDAGGDTWA